MRTVSSRAPRRAAALVVASAAVLLAAACGGGSDDSSGGGSSGGGQNGGGNQAFAAYTECLAKNGVTITMPSRAPREGGSRGPGEFPSGMPRPSGSGFPGRGDGSGFPGGGGGFFQKPENVDEATWQKAQEACASVRPSFAGGRNGGGNGQNAAFQNCLRDHGVTASSGPLDENDATVKKALETCRVLQQPQASATPTS